MPPLLARVHLLVRSQASQKKLKQRGDLVKRISGNITEPKSRKCREGFGKVEIVRQPVSCSFTLCSLPHQFSLHLCQPASL